jgi:hypothetical protein
MSLPIAILLLAAAPAGEGPPTFERDVRPILARRCTACHNARKLDDADVSGGLALDSFDAALRGTAEHKVIRPGQSGRSELAQRLSDPDEDRRMPLGEDPLPAAQVDLIRRWIDAGAPRGEPVAATAEAAAPTRPARRAARTLDVVLPVAKAGGKDAAEVVLKVGPLPAATALAFRGDGGLLAVGTAGQVVVWDLLEGRPAAVLGDIPGAVHALAFSRDGRRLAVGAGLPARSGVVRVYTVPDGILDQDFAGHKDVVYALAFRPDGAQLASAGFDQTVRLWDLADGKAAGVFAGHSDFVYDVAYAADGRTALSVGKDRAIKRFDVATARGLRTYSDHDDEVLALAVRPDGRGFVTAGNEPQLRWWAPDGERPAQKVGGHSGPVHELAFSADGRRLISAGGDRSVRLWDGISGIFQRSLPGPTEWQYAVALSADGRLAAAGGWDGLVRVWDADPGTLRATLIQPPGDRPDQAEWLAVVPTGYLTAPPGLRKLIRWRVGGAETPADEHERPDLVARALRGEAGVAKGSP